MKSDHNQQIDMAGRLRDLEHFTGARRQAAEPDVIPVHAVPAMRVPVPRRSRVFLRHGGGHGVFAELTLTAPRPRQVHD